MDIANHIIYEQPLNELIRVCLRLEQLFAQADHQIQDTSDQGTRAIVVTIINILQLLERPDLKAKLAKELGHQIQILSRLERKPEVDLPKLDQLLQQLQNLSEQFINSSSKIGQPLRQVEMLNSLRLHLSTPGGGCSFDIPVYAYWLNQTETVREATVRHWLAEFDLVRLAVKLILKLVREESRSQTKQASNGFHQELLNPQTNLRLIRVGLPVNADVYPEISLSRHFLSIRFYSPSVNARPSQFQQNVPFWLSYCTA